MFLVAPCCSWAGGDQHRVEVIDWDARIFRIPNFVTEKEADELIELGHDALDSTYAHEDWRKRHTYTQVFYSGQQYKRHRILTELDERIARLTMVKRHAEESPLMFTRMIPGQAAGQLFGDQTVRNLHHDKNGRENRIVTVLVYLSSAADNEGGHTLFPGLAAMPCPRMRADMGGCTDVAGWFVRQLTELFRNGSRVVDPLALPDSASEAERASHTALLNEASIQCRMVQRSQTLSVRPQKGSALVFWHVEADGRPNMRAWHAACQAMSGPYRTAVQKFKELPRVSGEWVLDPSDGQPRWQSRPPSPGSLGQPPHAPMSPKVHERRGRDEL